MEKSRRLVRIVHALRRWVFPRSVGHFVGLWAPDVGTLARLFENIWHRDVAGVCGIVPVDGESAEYGTVPVMRDSVEYLKGLYEVVGVLFAGVLDPKVVDNEGESDVFGGVLPKRQGSGHRVEAEMGEVSFELAVGDEAGLLEARHAFSDL